MTAPQHPAWHAEFSPLSVQHLGAVFIGLAVVGIWIVLARRWRETPREPLLRGFGAGLMMMSQILMQIYWFVPRHFEPSISLPLHVCDAAAFLAPLALLGGWRWMRVLVVFWGLGLSTQGFITPTLEDGIGHQVYWYYWFNHLIPPAAALYEIAVRGLRPSYRDAWFAVGVSLLYVGVILVLNLATGWNYMFVGPGKPGQPTALDVLGPWPWRLLPMVLIGSGLFLAICWAIRVVAGAEETTPGPKNGARDAID